MEYAHNFLVVYVCAYINYAFKYLHDIQEIFTAMG